MKYIAIAIALVAMFTADANAQIRRVQVGRAQVVVGRRAIQVGGVRRVQLRRPALIIGRRRVGQLGFGFNQLAYGVPQQELLQQDYAQRQQLLQQDYVQPIIQRQQLLQQDYVQPIIQRQKVVVQRQQVYQQQELQQEEAVDNCYPMQAFRALRLGHYR